MLPQKILILGCNGFIGTALRKELSQRNVEVEGVDIVGDFGIKCKVDDKRVEYKIEDSDCVINLATMCNPRLYMKKGVDVIRSNFNPTIADWCTKHKKYLVAFSSCEVYGITGDSLQNDLIGIKYGGIQSTRWSYACAKQLMDRYIWALGIEHGLKATIIRPYNFFGVDMDSRSLHPRVLRSFLEACSRGESMKISTPISKRVITHISDGVEGVLKAVENRCLGIVNVGNKNNEIDMEELAKGIKKRWEKKYAMVLPDSEFMCGVDLFGEGYEDCDRRIPDVSILEGLGWQGKHDVESILDEVVESWK